LSWRNAGRRLRLARLLDLRQVAAGQYREEAQYHESHQILALPLHSKPVCADAAIHAECTGKTAAGVGIFGKSQPEGERNTACAKNPQGGELSNQQKANHSF
jgi:hypothetical protein